MYFFFNLELTSSTLGLHPTSLIVFSQLPLRTKSYDLKIDSHHKAFPSLQVLQACDLPAGLVSILTGRRDQLTAALANHSVIKTIWYWGSPEVRTECLYSRAGVRATLHEFLALDDAQISFCEGKKTFSPVASVTLALRCLRAPRYTTACQTPCPVPHHGPRMWTAACPHPVPRVTLL